MYITVLFTKSSKVTWHTLIRVFVDGQSAVGHFSLCALDIMDKEKSVADLQMGS